MMALIGNAIYSACQFGVLIAITRIGTIQDVGLFALALAVTAPVLMLANLQLRSLLASDAQEDFTFPSYLSLRIATTLLAILGLVLFASFCHPDTKEFHVIMAMTGAKSVEALGDLAYGLFQRHERLGQIARSSVLKGCGGLVALTITLIFTSDIATAIWSMAAAWGAVLVLVDLPGLKRVVGGQSIGLDGSLIEMRRLLRRALPMGFVAGMLSFASIIPGYLLELWHGSEALGRFSPMIYLLAVGNLVVMSAGGAALPRLANYHSSGNRHGFLWLSLKLTGVALVVSLTAILVVLCAGTQLLSLVYGFSYASEAPTLSGLTLAASLGWLASACGYCLTSARVLLLQLPLCGAAAFTGLITGWWLIPSHGMVGAVWVSVMIGAVLAAGYAVSCMLLIRRMEPSLPLGSGP